MQHLFTAWQEVSPRLRAAKQLLLFSDFDGTLSPIVEKPELAHLPEKAKKLLQKLAHHHSIKVGIVSGRALSDLKERVGLEGITYAGNHGLEIEGPGIFFINPVAEEVKPLLRLLYQVLSRALGAIKGAFVENKGLTLSVHYRQVGEHQTEEVKSAIESVVATSRAVGKIRTTIGKKVYEVRPEVEWDKGKAIELLMERHSRGGKRSPLVIFLGDDVTDEDGFRVVKEHNGISIFVGEEEAKSQASYFLRSPTEVERFMELLVEPQVRLENELA